MSASAAINHLFFIEINKPTIAPAPAPALAFLFRSRRALACECDCGASMCTDNRLPSGTNLRDEFILPLNRLIDDIVFLVGSHFPALTLFLLFILPFRILNAHRARVRIFII